MRTYGLRASCPSFCLSCRLCLVRQRVTPRQRLDGAAPDPAVCLEFRPSLPRLEASDAGQPRPVCSPRGRGWAKRMHQQGSGRGSGPLLGGFLGCCGVRGTKAEAAGLSPARTGAAAYRLRRRPRLVARARARSTCGSRPKVPAPREITPCPAIAQGDASPRLAPGRTRPGLVARRWRAPAADHAGSAKLMARPLSLKTLMAAQSVTVAPHIQPPSQCVKRKRPVAPPHMRRCTQSPGLTIALARSVARRAAATCSDGGGCTGGAGSASLHPAQIAQGAASSAPHLGHLVSLGLLTATVPHRRQLMHNILDEEAKIVPTPTDTLERLPRDHIVPRPNAAAWFRDKSNERSE